MKASNSASNEAHTEDFFQARAIVSFAAKNIKKIDRCLAWGMCSIGSFNRAIRGRSGTDISETFRIIANTLFQKPLNFWHSHHIYDTLSQMSGTSENIGVRKTDKASINDKVLSTT